MNTSLIALTLLFITVGQLLQKLAADRVGPRLDGIGMIAGLIKRPEAWAAVACLVIGMGFWLVVLFRMEVSQAYPYLGLGYVLVLLVSRFYLGEQISRGRWFGISLIVAGITTLSMG